MVLLAYITRAVKSTTFKGEGNVDLTMRCLSSIEEFVYTANYNIPGRQLGQVNN